MWLINTRTLALEYFVDPESESVRYAILSHRWGRDEDEINFQQFADLETAARKPGFAKIRMTCELARHDQLDYAWVDTCCIDKSSSAELSEAINSMYSWYRTSAVCYAYLADLDGGGDGVHKVEDDDWANHYHTGSPLRGIPCDTATMTAAELEPHRAAILESPFARSQWFTRGWTLQELIAPSHLIFYDVRWHRIGDKRSLHRPLQMITRIDSAVLLDNSQLITRSVWSRMSWAATRDTKRVEDIAYCLLGIFDVNMPLIYGEGYRAFQRLQEEITRKEGDVTILAWHAVGMPAPRYRPVQYRDATQPPESRGVFAWAPSEFLAPNVTQNTQTRNLIRGGEIDEDREAMGRVRAYKLEMGPQSSVIIRCREGKIRAVVLAQYRGLGRELFEYAELPMPRGLMHRPVVFHNLDGFAFRSVDPVHTPTGEVAMSREYDSFMLLGQHRTLVLEAMRGTRCLIKMAGSPTLTRVWPDRYWKDELCGWSFTQEQATIMTEPQVNKVYGILLGYITTQGEDEVGRPEVLEHRFAIVVGSIPKWDEDGNRLDRSSRLFGLCVGTNQQPMGTDTDVARDLRWLRQQVFSTDADLRELTSTLGTNIGKWQLEPHDGMTDQIGTFVAGGRRRCIDVRCSFEEDIRESEEGYRYWQLNVDVLSKELLEVHPKYEY